MLSTVYALYVAATLWAWFGFFFTWSKMRKDESYVPANLKGFNEAFAWQMSRQVYIRMLFAGAMLCTITSVFIPPWLTAVILKEIR